MRGGIIDGIARRRRVLPLIALGCALSGCAPTTELALLAPTAPRAFTEARPQAAPPVPMDWLASFGARELTDLATQTLSGSFDIEAAAARIEQAEALARATESALYPQVGASADTSRSRSPGTGRSANGPFEASVGGRTSLGLSASYVLDFWGRNRALAQSAAQDAIATRYDFETVVVSTLASLGSAYLQSVVARERLALARGNIATAERVLGAIRARVDVGTGTALDVAQQESVLANQRANVPALERQARQADQLVALIAGRTPESVRLRGARLSALRAPVVRPGLPSQLLLRRPDIAAAEARLAGAEADLAAARAAFLPSISLTAGAGLESIALRNLLRPEALALSLAAGLTQPIFDGGNLVAQADARAGRRRELLAVYGRSIVSALTDVESALVGLRKSAEEERLRGVAVEAARRAYRITEERLREGTIDVVTLLNTQQTLFQAQDAAVLARYQRLLAAITLYQALGGGFSREDATPRRMAETAR